MDCGFAERRLRVTSWPSLKRRYIMRLVILVSMCLAFLAIDRLVYGSHAAKLTDGLYDPNFHLFAEDLDIERMWDVSLVLGKQETLTSAVIVRDKPKDKERRMW